MYTASDSSFRNDYPFFLNDVSVYNITSYRHRLYAQYVNLAGLQNLTKYWDGTGWTVPAICVYDLNYVSSSMQVYKGSIFTTSPAGVLKYDSATLQTAFTTNGKVFRMM